MEGEILHVVFGHRSRTEAPWGRILVVNFNDVKAWARQFYFQALVFLHVKWDDESTGWL